MKRKNIPKQEIEKTLASLDGIERASTDPYFTTRLMARLEKEKSNATDLNLAWARPAFLLPVIALLLAAETYYLVQQNDLTATNRTDPAEAVASYFGFEQDLQTIELQ